MCKNMSFIFNVLEVLKYKLFMFYVELKVVFYFKYNSLQFMWFYNDVHYLKF